MHDSRWPLSAAATRLLLELPPAGSRPRPSRAGTDPLKLVLKELLARGVLTMNVKHRSGGERVILGAGEQPDSLPTPLWRLDDGLRRHLPGEVGQVLKQARRRNPHLIEEIANGTRDELVEHRLIEQHSFRRLGLVRAQGWTRTGRVTAGRPRPP